jgi:hypothetical protein
MKRNTLLLAFAAALLTAIVAFAQTPKKGTKSTPAAPQQPAAAQPQQQKLVRVATLNGIDVNREFQANVQLLQAQRQAAIELSSALEKEKDAKKKAEFKTQLDQVMAKLNENNAKMQQTYGFSLARNYSMIVETAHIYMFVTDEEAAKVEKVEKEQQAKAAAEKAKSGKK